MLISAIIIDDIINNNIISYVINGMLKYYLGYIGYKYIIKIKFLFFFYFFDMPIGTFKIRQLGCGWPGSCVSHTGQCWFGVMSCFCSIDCYEQAGEVGCTTHTYRLKQTVKTGLGTRPYLISFLLVPDPTPEPSSTVERSRTQRPGIRDVVRSPQDRLLVHRRAGRGEGESVLSTYSSRLGSRNF